MEELLPRALLIINPISGTREKSSLPFTVGEACRRAGLGLDIAESQSVGDVGRIAEQAGEARYHTVVVAGGDGTVSEVASRLRGGPTAMAIIPCGSGNGLARALGVPPDFESAAALLSEGKVIAIDNGLVDSRPFFCTCGVGFDAEISQRFAAEKRRGRLSYVKNVLLDCLNYDPQPYALSVNGQVITERAFLIAICNASQYGNNAYIAPKASLTDGLLDVTVMHSGNLLHTALLGMELFTGNLDKNTLIDTFRVSSISISRFHAGAAHIDGEPVKLGRLLEIGVEAANLRVYVPAQQPEFRPVISPLRAMLEDVVSDIRFTFRKR